MKVGNKVRYVCGNGGSVIISNYGEGLFNTGVEEGYAYWDDLYINSDDDMSLGLTDADVQGTLEEERGETILEFSVAGHSPSGVADFQFENLFEESSYRLLFDNELADTEFGKAYGNSDSNGTLSINRVIVPYE